RRVAVATLDGAVFRVDEPNRPGEAAGKQVARRDQSHAAGPGARPDQCHRARLQQGLEIADRHGGSLEAMRAASDGKRLDRNQVRRPMQVWRERRGLPARSMRASESGPPTRTWPDLSGLAVDGFP